MLYYSMYFHSFIIYGILKLLIGSTDTYFINLEVDIEKLPASACIDSPCHEALVCFPYELICPNGERHIGRQTRSRSRSGVDDTADPRRFFFEPIRIVLQIAVLSVAICAVSGKGKGGAAFQCEAFGTASRRIVVAARTWQSFRRRS